MKIEGMARKVGDNVDTDQMYPSRYTSTSDPEEMAKHCMEDYDPGFLGRMEKGDLIIGGINFGCGSSREHAPKSVKAAGFSCVIAKSFSRIFYRNSINIGLPILVCPEAVDDCMEGDELEVDLEQGRVLNRRLHKEYKVPPFPAFLQNIMTEGGLMGRIRKEMEEQKQ